MSSALLNATEIRQIAAALGVQPTKTLGQNFVIDAAIVRKIVAESGLAAAPETTAAPELPARPRVLEIGPGLGSLTLALLETGALVSAVEIDPVLAGALPETVRAHQGAYAADRLAVLRADALAIAAPEQLALPAALAASDERVFAPTHLVANLPYNVAVPVLLNLLAALPSLRTVTVMVQSEVADRLAAQPGAKAYGVPSAKLAWYGKARRGVKIARSVFWPVPNVDSALVHVAVTPPAQRPQADRQTVFALIDAAFSQRRKMLRSALAPWAGSPARAEQLVRAAGIDPQLRGEKLALADFVAIAG